MFLTNALGEEIFVYCLLDSDYHTAEAIAARYEEARRVGVRLHIWQRKEIENYLLVPSAIVRLIAKRLGKQTDPPSEERVRARLEKIAETKKDEAFDAISQEVLGENRSRGAKFANEAARKWIEEAWSSFDGKLSTISGKFMLSRISEWAQRTFGAMLSARRIARELRASEIPPEMRGVITAIEEKSDPPSHGDH
jgi:hypothetical protein